MMQIHMESPYAGYFERVADAIKAKLSPEAKQAILEIKHSIPKDISVMSIEIYQSVLRDGVSNLVEFLEWKNRKPAQDIIQWMP